MYKNQSITNYGIICILRSGDERTKLFDNETERNSVVDQFRKNGTVEMNDKSGVQFALQPMEVLKFKVTSVHRPNIETKYRTDGILQEIEGFEEFSNLVEEITGENVFENIFDTNNITVGDAVKVERPYHVMGNKRVELNPIEQFNGLVYSVDKDKLTLLVFNGMKLDISSKDILYGRYRIKKV